MNINFHLINKNLRSSKNISTNPSSSVIPLKI